MRARPNNDADFRKFRLGLSRAEVVSVMPDASMFGRREVLPRFVRLDFPGVEPNAAFSLLEKWKRICTVDVVGNPANNRYQIQSSKISDIDDQGVLGGRCDLEIVEPIVLALGGSIVNSASNNVIFDMPDNPSREMNGDELVEKMCDTLDNDLYVRQFYVDEADFAQFELGNVPTDLSTLLGLMKSTLDNPKEERKQENVEDKSGRMKKGEVLRTRF